MTANSLYDNLDVPFDELDGRCRRIIFHGAGETWYSAGRGAKPQPASKRAAGMRPAPPLGFAFQYKGLFPAIEEAGRVSF